MPASTAAVPAARRLAFWKAIHRIAFARRDDSPRWRRLYVKSAALVDKYHGLKIAEMIGVALAK